MKVILAVCALAAVSGAAFAQEANPPIIVEAQRNAQTVRNYVEAISVTSRSAGVLGRWNQRICPSVAGAAAADAQVIIDQIARRANAVGLQTGASGCTPNITILVTPNSDNLTRQIYDQRRQVLLGANGVESSTLGSAALEDFVNTPRPVRWWIVSQTVMSDGHVLSDITGHALQGSGAASARATDAAATGQGASGGGEGIAGVNGARSNGSRLSGSTRQDFNYALVIIDSTRTAGVPLSAIADYTAFVALAQINTGATAGAYPTILSLFATPTGQTRPNQLTSWDVSYLDGLYHMTRNARGISQQREEVALRMVRP